MRLSIASARPTQSHTASPLLLGLVLLGPLATGAGAQDRVVLHNGVALEGEIKEARRGEVAFDNEELDVVRIDVEDIAALTSPGFFEVIDAAGGIHRGSLVAGEPGTVVVTGPLAATALALTDIVQILAFDAGFWGRTSGHLDIGASLAAASALRSLLVGGQFAYRGPRWGMRHNLDLYGQRQTTVGAAGDEIHQTTRRVSVESAATRYLGRWGVVGSAGFEMNEELGLQSRVQLGLLGSYRVVRNQAMELGLGAGAVSNTENFMGEDKDTEPEIAAAAVLDVFDQWDVDVYVALAAYKSAGGRDRVRGDIDGRISWEVIDDFTIGISILERLDSNPPAVGSPGRDYQYGLTLGWTWS